MSDPQRAASDPGASVWVAASAGTGKTKVLTDRVLRLLLGGTPPERILCLTFTKAAAAEMANRVNRALGEWAAAEIPTLRKSLHDLTGHIPGDDELAEARRLFARVLDAPGGLKILTIHSFCQSLLGRFPLEANVPPHFRVLDERTASEMLEAAQNQVLAGARTGNETALREAIDAIATLVDERGFRELMKELTHERARLERLVGGPGGPAGAIAATRDGLELDDDDTVTSVLNAARDETALDARDLKTAADAMAKGSPSDQKGAAKIAAWLAERQPTTEAFETYCSVFFTQAGEHRARLATKQVLEQVPEVADILAAEAARLALIRNKLRALAVAANTTALLHLSAALMTRYRAEKRRHAGLDYDDLILDARDLLHERGIAPWVLYKLDGGLDHILIDEGQDTNPDQWEVVTALAEEFFAGVGAREELRTVFAVGDAKQSIYSFQRADPEAFDKVASHFAARVTSAARDWRPIDLMRSFRSTPAVLEAVDAVFARDEARVGLFSESIRHDPDRVGTGGLVELWPAEKPLERDDEAPWLPPVDQRPSDDPSHRLAARIASRIKDWIDDGEVLEARGRPVTPGDVMILVQRRTAFVNEMVRELKVRDISVAGVDRMVLTDQLPVMDLVAQGRFLLLPEDDLTLAVVLKSPLVGLGEDDLFDLAHGRGEHGLWQTLKRRAQENESFGAAHRYLAGLLARVDFDRPFDSYAEVLSGLGGRERLVARLGREANDPIDEFLALALAYEAAHPPSLQGFLHWVEAGEAEVKRDLEQGRDEVRVMTVHGAKGLQAPVVFLPDTCRGPYHQDRLLWSDGGPGDQVLLWPGRKANDDDVCDQARETAKRRREEEYHRLLYAAMTRAEDRLYICGWETAKGRADGCWYDLMARALEARGDEVTLDWDVAGRRLISPQEAPPEEPGVEATTPFEIDALPPWATVPPPPEPAPPRPLAPSRPEGEEPAVRSPLGADDGAGFRRGRLIHRLLELLPEVAPEHRTAAAHRFLARRAHDLDTGQQEEIAVEALGVLEDPAFAPVFAPGSFAEVALAGVLGDRVMAGQVDRLVITDSAILVVDYKSNRPPPEHAAEVPAIYLRQMAAYRAALAAIYPGIPVRCALLWTNTPRLMPLDEEDLAAAAP
jgi:ATP-dependent helicase/nuclease subunit A